MFESREFGDAHVMFLYENKLIVGLSRYGELTAFGGRSESAETLMATIIREYIEEAHEVIVPISELIQAVTKTQHVLVQPRRNGSFSFTAIVPLREFDMRRAREEFQNLLGKAQKSVYREVTDVVEVSLEELFDAIARKDRQVSAGIFREPTFRCLSEMFIKL